VLSSNAASFAAIPAFQMLSSSNAATCAAILAFQVLMSSNADTIIIT